MVLLGPKSRSPSPGKMKGHRSRSPNLAKFQGLMLRSSSRDQAASRSPSPQGRRGSSILKSEIPSIQFSKDSPRQRSKSRDASKNVESLVGPRLQSPWRFDENPLSRADPRNLGLLPAVRLETIDQVMGSRRESADQGLPARRMSPTSPTAALASLFSTSPKEGLSPDHQGPSHHSREAGH